MIKKSFNFSRPGGRIDKLRPAANPDWYKRFRQLASRADKSLKIKL